MPGHALLCTDRVQKVAAPWQSCVCDQLSTDYQMPVACKADRQTRCIAWPSNEARQDITLRFRVLFGQAFHNLALCLLASLSMESFRQASSA